MKWLGVCVAALAVVPLAKAAGVTLSNRSPAPELEAVRLFPGEAGNADLSAWVVETQNGPTPPTPSGLEASSNWSTGFRRSVANRNRNPLNLKFGSDTRRYVDLGLATISDTIPKDGGRFLRFNSPDVGFRAAITLLKTPSYTDVHLDRALRRWSHDGYGAEILAGTRLRGRESVADLDRDDFRILLHAMATTEGYRSNAIADEIGKALSP